MTDEDRYRFDLLDQAQKAWLLRADQVFNSAMYETEQTAKTKAMFQFLVGALSVEQIQNGLDELNRLNNRRKND